jgi:hypothetical protein
MHAHIEQGHFFSKLLILEIVIMNVFVTTFIFEAQNVKKVALAP